MKIEQIYTGCRAHEDVVARGLRPLAPDQFEATAKQTESIILDTRKPETFSKGFIPNSIFVGIDGNFATWVGTLVKNIKQNILIVADPGREQEVVTRLSRVGYDHCLGYLKGGFESWKKANKEIDRIETINANDFPLIMKKLGIHIVDVRKKSEYDTEHLPRAINIPLDFINSKMQELDKNKTYYVHCAGGYRSVIFNSILRAWGYMKLIDIEGGLKSIRQTGKFKTTDYVRPSSLL